MAIKLFIMLIIAAFILNLVLAPFGKRNVLDKKGLFFILVSLVLSFGLGYIICGILDISFQLAFGLSLAISGVEFQLSNITIFCLKNEEKKKDSFFYSSKNRVCLKKENYPSDIIAQNNFGEKGPGL